MELNYDGLLIIMFYLILREDYKELKEIDDFFTLSPEPSQESSKLVYCIECLVLSLLCNYSHSQH